jgi:hypothetical protein
VSGDRERPRLGTGGGRDDGRSFSRVSVRSTPSPVNAARCLLCGSPALAHVCGEECLSPFRRRHSYAYLAEYGALGFCPDCAPIVGAAPLLESHYRPGVRPEGPRPAAARAAKAAPPPPPTRPPQAARVSAPSTPADPERRRCWQGVRL